MPTVEGDDSDLLLLVPGGDEGTDGADDRCDLSRVEEGEVCCLLLSRNLDERDGAIDVPERTRVWFTGR